MTTITQNRRGFIPFTQQEKEINLLRWQKMNAEKAGNIALAAALQIAIDQFANTQGAKEIRSHISRLPSDKKMLLTRILFGTKSQITPAFTQKEKEQIKKGMTTNGVILYAEDGFVKGSLLQVATPEGKITAGPGTYNLDNGDVIEVGEEGIIISVNNPIKQLTASLKQLKKDESEKSLMRHLHPKAKHLARVKTYTPDPGGSLNFWARSMHPMQTITEWSKDGTKVLTENQSGFIKGANLFVVSPKETTPAPNGRYEMESGNVLQVKDGVITSVSKATDKKSNPKNRA